MGLIHSVVTYPFRLAIALLPIAVLPSLPAIAEVIPDFSSDVILAELWYKEEIYFQPVKLGDLNWNGQMLYYPTKKCFELRQPETDDKVAYRQITCEAQMSEKAFEPYTKISEFQKFKSTFLDCVDRQDKKCLRGFISKTLELSLGVDGYDDRRDDLLVQWKADDYAKLARLIRKGVRKDGPVMRFPLKPGAGQRGTFRLVDGGWRLVSYLAGD